MLNFQKNQFTYLGKNTAPFTKEQVEARFQKIWKERYPGCPLENAQKSQKEDVLNATILELEEIQKEADKIGQNRLRKTGDSDKRTAQDDWNDAAENWKLSRWKKFWRWTGISEKKGWDWAQLSIGISIPVAVFIGTQFLNMKQQEIANERYQQEILKNYLDAMNSLLIEKNLRTSKKEDATRNVARTRTLTALRQMDGQRRGEVVKFLLEAGLIEIKEDESVINLEGATLENAQLKNATLRKINLQGVDLTNADLQDADLTEGNLEDANLSKAKLANTLLINVRLVEATMIEADLKDADLTGSDLTSAIVSESQLLQGTILCGTKRGFDGEIVNPNCDRVAVKEYEKGERRDFKYRSKLAALDKIIKDNPQSAIAYNDRAILQYNHDEFDKAIQDFDKGIKIDSQYTSAYLFRGYAYVIRGKANNNNNDYELAIQDFNELITRNPYNANAYSGRGDANNNKNDYELAIKDYNQAIKLNPNLASNLENEIKAIRQNKLGKK